jgi:hypothetical protein
VRRSGQRPGQHSRGGRLSQPSAKRQNPRHCRGSGSGASRTRTGDLLGAIQACASPEFGSFAGISRCWRAGLRSVISASFRSFRLGSGQRNASLARSSICPCCVSPVGAPFHRPAVRRGRGRSLRTPAARPTREHGSRSGRCSWMRRERACHGQDGRLLRTTDEPSAYPGRWAAIGSPRRVSLRPGRHARSGVRGWRGAVRTRGSDVG